MDEKLRGMVEGFLLKHSFDHLGYKKLSPCRCDDCKSFSEALRATPQAVPVSVPSLEELTQVFRANYKAGNDDDAGIRAIHALLTARPVAPREARP